MLEALLNILPVPVVVLCLGWLLIQNRKQNEQIMKTQAELVADVQLLTKQLADATQTAKDTNNRIIKIGTETDGLLEAIKRLEEALQNQTAASPELIAAVEAATNQAASLKAAVDEAGTSAQQTDDKVADAPAGEAQQ